MAALIKIDHSFTSAAGRASAIRFCSRCGEPAEEPPYDAGAPSRARACARRAAWGCSSAARARLFPAAGAAFVIATVEATVSAVSEAAEPVFGVEQSILGTPVADLLRQPDGRGPPAAHRHPGRDPRP